MFVFPAFLATSGPAATPLTWPVLLAAALVTVLCVVIHFEALSFLIRFLCPRKVAARFGIPAVVLYPLTIHVIEIALYALTYAILIEALGPRIGALEGIHAHSITDMFYFSIAVYTTVSFGDITPEGPLRILTGIEALTGLVLVTWSASFTFLIMQHYWRNLVSADSQTDRDTPPDIPPPGHH